MYLVQELDSIHSTTTGERYALKKASLTGWDACSGLAQPRQPRAFVHAHLYSDGGSWVHAGRNGMECCKRLGQQGSVLRGRQL